MHDGYGKPQKQAACAERIVFYGERILQISAHDHGEWDPFPGKDHAQAGCWATTAVQAQRVAH